MAIYVNGGHHGDHYNWRRMNNIKGLVSLAVLVFVAGIVLSVLTGVPYYGGLICTTAIIMGSLGFFLLWKYKGSGRVTVVSTSGGHQSTTIQSSSMMSQSYQQSMQQTVRSHSIVSMTSRTNVQRSSSVARLQDSGVLGWGGAPSSQPVDNGWMHGNPARGGHTQPPPPPPPPHAAQPGPASQPGGYQQPGGYPQPGGYTQPGSNPQPGGYPQPGGHTQPGGYPQPGGHTQPGGFTNPGGNRPSSTVGGFTNPAGPSTRPGPSSYTDAPPSYADAVRLPGKS